MEAQNKPNENKMTKAQFVASLPADMSAAEVSQKAKEAGLEITTGYVYTIRSAQKRKAKSTPSTSPKRPPAKKAVTPKRAAAKPAEPPKPKTPSHTVESILKAVAAEIGLAKAISILEEERAKVRAVIG